MLQQTVNGKSSVKCGYKINVLQWDNETTRIIKEEGDDNRTCCWISSLNSV